MKIGIAQIDCTLGDIRANLAKLSLYAEKAKNSACDVLVLPEMADTGYEMSVIEKSACTWKDIPFKTLKELAVKNEIFLICGLSEKVEDQIFNSIAAFNPRGELIGKYRKTHLASYPPLNEGAAITPGKFIETIQIGEFKCGLMICYDLRFPELCRSLTLKGAEAVILCSAWPFPRQRHWEILIKAIAIENQVYFIAANRIGSDGPVTFCGSSCLIDPYGVVVSSGAENREELISSKIKKDIIKTVRENMPIFKHRRVNLYNL